MGFYDEVMREIVLALGGALFVGSALALIRRRSDSSPSPRDRTSGGVSHGSNAADLAQAPLARTVTYMLIGLIVAAWALASIINH